MKSMTGYGKATVVRENRELTIELKSVNHRFLDISTKIPRAFLAFEDVIRNGIARGGISRGHIDVFLNYKLNGDGDKIVSCDTALADSFVSCASLLKERYGSLPDDFTLSALMRSPDVISITQAEENEELLRKMLEEAVLKAAENLDAMREAEGNKLKADLLSKIDYFEKLLAKVKSLAPSVVTQYREKLRQRISESLNDVALDESKLANELCFYADKSCIDEEITRLESHIAHARSILASCGPVGRKLDFLLQEFNRETNTICSKSGVLELTDVALEMKNEIEKIREQVQNLE